MLTSFADDEALFDAIMAGASGYVLKQIRGTDLVGAVRTVAAGGSLLDPRTTAQVLERLRAAAERQGPAGRADRAGAHGSSTLIGEGLTNRQIGERMFLAEKTVKNYVSHLLAKLGMQRRTQAAVLATELRRPATSGPDRPEAGRPCGTGLSARRSDPPVGMLPTGRSGRRQTVRGSVALSRRGPSVADSTGSGLCGARVVMEVHLFWAFRTRSGGLRTPSAVRINGGSRLKGFLTQPPGPIAMHWTSPGPTGGRPQPARPRSRRAGRDGRDADKPVHVPGGLPPVTRTVLDDDADRPPVPGDAG